MELYLSLEIGIPTPRLYTGVAAVYQYQAGRTLRSDRTPRAAMGMQDGGRGSSGRTTAYEDGQRWIFQLAGGRTGNMVNGWQQKAS